MLNEDKFQKKLTNFNQILKQNGMEPISQDKAKWMTEYTEKMSRLMQNVCLEC